MAHPLALIDRCAKAPMVLVALALTAGVCLDRVLPLSAWAWGVASVIATALLLGSYPDYRRTMALALTLALVTFGGFYHRYRVDSATDDLLPIAGDEPRWVRFRGSLAEEPALRTAEADVGLKSLPPPRRSAGWSRSRPSNGTGLGSRPAA